MKEKKGQAEFKPRIVAFVCKWCSGRDGTGQGDVSEDDVFASSGVRPVSVMCSGRVQPGFILKAFELGADGVIVCGCELGSCHYSTGSEKQTEMFETSKKLIGILGLEPQRLRLELLSPNEADGLDRVLQEFLKEVRRVGPSPLGESGGSG
jgi:coenzyme F420-reducing hydrogenase delta subunit